MAGWMGGQAGVYRRLMSTAQSFISSPIGPTQSVGGGLSRWVWCVECDVIVAVKEVCSVVVVLCVVWCGVGCMLYPSTECCLQGAAVV